MATFDMSAPSLLPKAGRTPAGGPVAGAGLRGVAALEALKGFLLLVAAMGLLSLLHGDGHQAVQTLVHQLRLDPTDHYPRLLLAAAARTTDTRLALLAAGAIAYASLLIVEAYGLWWARAWGQWLAVLSGASYVPIELAELVRHATEARLTVLLANLFIVGYLCHMQCGKKARPEDGVPIAPGPRPRAGDVECEPRPGQTSAPSMVGGHGHREDLVS